MRRLAARCHVQRVIVALQLRGAAALQGGGSVAGGAAQAAWQSRAPPRLSPASPPSSACSTQHSRTSASLAQNTPCCPCPVCTSRR